MKQLYYNGNIITMNEAQPKAEAILMKGGVIVAIGSNEELLAEREDAEVVDLDGATVLPGFIDSHSHSDKAILTYPDQREKIEQGITTDKIFDSFNNELYIPPNKTGKMTHSYIDEVKQFELTDYLGNTKFINSLSSLHLSECEYTLSLSRQYLKFIESLSQGYILKAIK